ncbi:para-nitrobenzyl esterase isoform X2 [Aplysia californica]|uniref:Carboxylic ester hydrolase n=1 Tax=Aplysia californica TaxID=6500 RepID=A0ABM1VV69_APLCA|nr:para-nitrobenzyl esterase isoform X2 [Aplysia californica]
MAGRVHLVFVVVVLLTTSLVRECQATAPTVSAPAGRFQGLLENDQKGQPYFAFKGIPYAKPPVGELRFALPEPLPKLDGTFDATKYGQICPMPDMYLELADMKQGEEDCLFLNIYAKELAPSSPKKVMVFIHGGGYVVGSSNEYNTGNVVTTHDIVFVTINYRLGVLGFLSTGDQSSPGNFGLWDMTLALKWVKNNIASFGGDPNDVTISGESAGGSAVGYLSISPHTKGLFSKAYPQSGTPTSAFGKALDPQKDALTFGASVNCFEGDASQKVDSDTTRTVVECLRNLPLSNFTQYMVFGVDKTVFVPIVDKDFVPRPPLQLLQDDSYLEDVGFFKRSYLVGIDNNEASIMRSHAGTSLAIAINSRDDITDEEKAELLRKTLSSAYNFYARSRMDAPVSTTIVDKIVSWYDRRYGDDILAMLSSDLNFEVPTFDFIDAASRGRDTKVWLFHFNHFPRFMKGKEKGIVHGLDLCYWFDLSVERMEKLLRQGMDGTIGMDDEDLDLKSRLSKIIADFTKTGSADWPQYNMEDMKYLDFKPRAEVRQGLEMDKRRFWLEELTELVPEKHVHTDL